MLYWILRVAFWVTMHLICRYRVSGRGYVPLKGPLVIVANHLSWLDPIILGLVLPRRVWFFSKAEIFHWPIIGLLCTLTEQIPVHRGESDRAALEKALIYLREGRALMIFPEGTVARQEQLIAAHAGAAMLAIRTGAKVLPIAHRGTRNILRSPLIWFPRVDMHIGEPYRPVLPAGVSRKVALKSITADMMTRIAQMLPDEQRGIYLNK